MQQAWGELRPFFKLEWLNPTGSFKDRGSAVMLSFLRQIGHRAVLEDSSGNGGSSVAGYGAAGGMRVKIFAPAYTSPAKVAQVRAYGAEVQLVGAARRTSQTRPSVSRARSSTPATTGSRSSCRARSRWPTNCGRISVSPRPTTSSSRSAPAAVCSAAPSASASSSPPARSRSCRGCSRPAAELLAVDASFQAGRRTPVPREVTNDRGRHRHQHPLRLREIVACATESGGGTIALTEDEIVAALRRLARPACSRSPLRAAPRRPGQARRPTAPLSRSRTRSSS